jgi:hypothetical protein
MGVGWPHRQHVGGAIFIYESLMCGEGPHREVWGCGWELHSDPHTWGLNILKGASMKKSVVRAIMMMGIITAVVIGLGFNLNLVGTMLNAPSMIANLLAPFVLLCGVTVGGTILYWSFRSLFDN